MRFTTLVDTDTLFRQLDDSCWIVFDTRFVLSDADAGERAYAAGHIPGARYANLDKDLSAPQATNSGRHPLPNPGTLAEKLGQWGVDKNKQVVVYDDACGAMAARLWWLMRWLGHEAVAVLDGGLHKWQDEGKPLTTMTPNILPSHFFPEISDDMCVTADQVEAMLNNMSGQLIDARAAKRFRGEQEPLDKVAGHVPGAVNLPYAENLNIDGKFKPAVILRDRYLNVLKDVKPMDVVHMCGSGVTACHNLLAMEHAGLSGSKLYAGSWSEWITDNRRPVATGE
ncbi:MAG: sulfurtransferase [Sulfuricaulis sp.]|uniref:sulfurtransferase n=1 Tax=Sulfuricaulis sp. TaxID=2003553 RepID=UPI0034A1765C